MRRVMIAGLIAGLLTGLVLFTNCQKKRPESMQERDKRVALIVDKMLAEFGQEHRERIGVGVEQVNEFWTEADGDTGAMLNFCRRNFIVEPQKLQRCFDRLEKSFETLSGVLLEQRRQFQWNLQVATGPILPIDYLLGNFSLASHVEEDLFKSKIAFFVLLNFPQYTLAEVLEEGDDWSRQKWAEVRLAQQFTSRVPGNVNQTRYEAYVAADNYISNYNIYMGNLRTEDGRQLFPDDLKLISHWGLRDELKAQYAAAEGLARQQLIYEVMQRIILQQIPAFVIDNPDVVWTVATNELGGAPGDTAREADDRYRHLLNIFQTEKEADPYYPLYPSKIERRFNQDREIPERVVADLFDELLSSREFKKTAKLVQKRLGRELEPFDIWYNGFKPQGRYAEEELDRIVRERFPTVTSFDEQTPAILHSLGFDRETAEFLGSKIDVDPARGAGHAQGAGRRSDNAHLRTRVPENGMNYKGFNIAMHELGHCVEQVFTLNRIDHTLLEGVPNTAFTEAFAFLFQQRDLAVLGLDEKDKKTADLVALNQLWSVCEIAGVSLVDMRVWRWMYDHPTATPAELREATIRIAQEVWNKYFAPVLGHQDAIILAIYSHMIDAGLYLPDYPIGHIIQFQIEQYIQDRNLAQEMERMCLQGSITPNFWMEGALGEEISLDPLLKAVSQALKRF